MRPFQSWFVLGWLGFSSLLGCVSDPTCEDLANCAPSGASGTMSSGSGSSSGMPGAEDCTNGADDDGDGQTDCADTDCSSNYTCIPEVPAGFNGIVTIAVTPFGDNAPPCAGGATPTSYYQNPAMDSCDACTCDVSGVQCSPAQLATSFGFDMTCNNPQPVGPIAPNQCQQVFGSSAMVQNAPTVIGSCTANMGSPTMKPPMETTITACSIGMATGGGCDASGTCVASDNVANAEHVCVYRAGHEACPGDWPLALYAFESYVDDRTGCTPCGCTTACEGGTYSIFPNDPTCAGTGIPVEPVGACVMGSGFQTGVSMTALMATCAVTGGAMMGSVTPMNETTFCCY